MATLILFVASIGIAYLWIVKGAFRGGEILAIACLLDFVTSKMLKDVAVASLDEISVVIYTTVAGLILSMYIFGIIGFAVELTARLVKYFESK